MDSISNEQQALLFFFILLSVGWVGTSAFLSMLSGWGHLASRFRCVSKFDGETFRFSGMSMRSGILSASYGNCAFITVGRPGIGISLLFLFRVFHPPLLIPWSDIEAVHREQRWFSLLTAVYIKGFNRRILIRGRAGRKIYEMYNEQFPSAGDV